MGAVTANLALRPEFAAETRRERFCHELRSQGGNYGLFDYTASADQYVRIDFDCLLPGQLKLVIDKRVTLNARAYGGTAYVPAFFLASGSRLQVLFDTSQSFYGERLVGSITLAPAIEEALVAARRLFGLPVGYTAETLSRAYKRLIMRHHPDRPGGDNEKMKEVVFFHTLLKAALD